METAIGRLSPEQLAAARRLSSARGETIEDILRRFTARELSDCPPRFSKHLAAVKRAKLAATGVRNGLAYAQLPNGRVFYSYMSQPTHRREYRYLADILPANISEDTYLAAIDVVQRYLTDFTWPPDGLLPESGSNIVEVGAYLGHKTIRFAEELAGNGGKVLAVEMMPANCEILRRNIIENGMESVIDVRDVGVWNKQDTVTVFSKGRQRNSILPIEKLEGGTRLRASVETLDQILDTWGVRPVDLIFITINGVEIEALEGFHPEGRDVRAIFVAAPYERDDQPNHIACRRILEERGFELIDIGNPSRVLGKMPTQNRR